MERQHIEGGIQANALTDLNGVKGFPEFCHAAKGKEVRPLPGLKEELNKRVYEAAGRMYGNPMPKEIQDRIERELDLISSSCSESRFLVASEVVKTLEAGGFPHGVRGSVGNTLIGHLLGISAVDPMRYGLRPEIFLGFEGEKEADIDFNIPEEAREPLMKRLNCTGLHILGHRLFSELKELQDLTGATPDDDELCQGPIGGAHEPAIAWLMDKAEAKTFADSVILTGLAHGTDTWTGNAELLLKNGTCSLQEVIAFRDDVFEKLLNHGYDPREAYRLMEMIRKGKGYCLTGDEIDAMREAGIEEWYIESLLKIKYLFPKSHGVEYALQAARADWYEKHYPEAHEAVHRKYYNEER